MLNKVCSSVTDTASPLKAADTQPSVGKVLGDGVFQFAWEWEVSKNREFLFGVLNNVSFSKMEPLVYWLFSLIFFVWNNKTHWQCCVSWRLLNWSVEFSDMHVSVWLSIPWAILKKAIKFNFINFCFIYFWSFFLRSSYISIASASSRAIFVHCESCH